MTVKMTVYVIVGDSTSVGGWCETFATKKERDEAYTSHIEDLLAQEGRNLTDFESEDEACMWLDDETEHERPTTEEHVLEFPDIAGADVKLWQLITACQMVSQMAPAVEPPMPMDLPYAEQPDSQVGVEDLAHAVGFYHAAELVRSALRGIGIEPASGTTLWEVREQDDEAA